MFELRMLKRKYYIDLPGGEETAVAYLKGIMEDARTTTLQQIAKLSRAEFHWQYAEGWNTVGALLSHVAAIEHFFRIEFVEGRKLSDEENKRWEPALDMGEHLPKLITGNTVEYYVKMLGESRTMMLESMKALTVADLTKRTEGYDPVEGCNLAWVLYHMVEDEIYHRGQIAIVKKLYGESDQSAI
jgi:uncharacterized damage-inducible protein DinB